MFLHDEGHEVSLSHSGTDGFKLAISTEFHAIVLDIMLPELSGWQVLEKIRKNIDTPIIILSALENATDRVRALSDGADDFLRKPFYMGELLARIHAISRRQNTAAQNIEVGDVMINRGRRQLSYKGEPVSLTPTEYALVELLIENRGVAIDRVHIHEAVVQDKSSAVVTSAVDVHISAIRHKTCKEFILNKRGKGFLIP